MEELMKAAPITLRGQMVMMVGLVGLGDSDQVLTAEAFASFEFPLLRPKSSSYF